MFSLILIVVGIFIDQISKYLAVKNLKDQSAKILIDKVLRLVYVENRGAAFGILQNQQVLFAIITIVTLIFLGYFLIKYYSKLSIWNIVSLSFIISGTIGNFIDRLRLGYVIDFISVRILDRYNFAVFNIADSLIVLGGLMLVISILLTDSK